MRYIPYDLKQKIEKANQTIYENANPQMEILLRRARSGLTSTDLFYVQTIREADNLEALGLDLQRPYADKAPTKAWNIYIQGGICKVATKNLPSKVKEAWLDVLTIGPAAECDIAFNGEWVRDEEGRQNLITESIPWIFWTDTTGNLYTRYYNTGEPLLLATNVSSIAALRGWKNVEVWEEDQGIICAYIKAGAVCYRNYCRQADGGAEIWEPERTVNDLPTPAQSVSLFRTNDYRMGFVSDSNGQITWSISRRNWAGMAVPAERITAKPSMTISFNEIFFKDAFSPAEYISAKPDMEVNFCPADYTIEIISVNKVDARTVEIVFNHPVMNAAGQKAAFNVHNTIPYTVNTTTQGKDGYTVNVTLNEDILNTEDTYFEYDSAIGTMRIAVTPYCKPKASFTATLKGKPPEGHLREYISARPNMTISFNEIFFKNGYAPAEYISAKPSMTIVFTKVNSDPI